MLYSRACARESCSRGVGIGKSGDTVLILAPIDTERPLRDLLDTVDGHPAHGDAKTLLRFGSLLLGSACLALFQPLGGNT